MFETHQLDSETMNHHRDALIHLIHQQKTLHKLPFSSGTNKTQRE